MQSIFEKIKDLIASKKGVSPETIQLSQSFEELELDSLDSVELNIPNQEVLQIKTIQEAVNSLSKLVNA